MGARRLKSRTLALWACMLPVVGWTAEGVMAEGAVAAQPTAVAATQPAAPSSPPPYKGPLAKTNQPPSTPLKQVNRALGWVGLEIPLFNPPLLAARVDRPGAKEPLGLRESWVAAMANDPTLRAARAANLSAQERLPQARSQLLPSLQAGVTRTNNLVERDTVNSLRQELNITDRYKSGGETLTLRQPLFRMAQWAGVVVADYLVDEADAALARETQNLAVRLGGVFFQAMLARDQLELNAAQRRFLEALLESATKGFAAGVATRTDILEAQSRLDLNRAQAVEVQQRYENARRQLQVIIQVPFDELAVLNPDRLSMDMPVPSTAEEWINLAFENSPELKSLEAQRKAARAEINRARAGHLPTVDLVAQYQRSQSENAISPQSQFTNRSVSVQLNVPIYSGGFVNSVTRQALADYERSGEVVQSVRQDLSVRVHREFSAVTEGVARVRALMVALNSADNLVAAARQSYRAGVRSLTDILNAEQQRMSVRRDLSEARYSLMLARVRLNALVGRVHEGVIAEIGRGLE